MDATSPANDDDGAVDRAIHAWMAILARMCRGEETMWPGGIVFACVDGAVRGAVCDQESRHHYMKFTINEAILLREQLGLAIDRAAAEGGAA